jgi:hypothetical protein
MRTIDQSCVKVSVTEATTNGTLRRAYDNNGLKDSAIRTD